jgi:hypothetical protein
MDRMVMCVKEEAAQDLAIAAIEKAAIVREQAATMAAVKGGQPIPGKTRPVMVRSMKIIVQVQERERPGALDDRDPVTGRRVGAMLGIGA